MQDYMREIESLIDSAKEIDESIAPIQKEMEQSFTLSTDWMVATSFLSMIMVIVGALDLLGILSIFKVVATPAAFIILICLHAVKFHFMRGIGFQNIIAIKKQEIIVNQMKSYGKLVKEAGTRTDDIAARLDEYEKMMVYRRIR